MIQIAVYKRLIKKNDYDKIICLNFFFDMTGCKKQYSLRNKNSVKQKTTLSASDYK